MEDSASGSRIVVGIDPSKHPLDPLRLGGRLARRMRLPIVLATVFPHGPGDSDEELRAEAREDLLGLGRLLDDVVVDDAIVLISRSPARALHELSERKDTAMIVVGSTTRGALRRVLPGSVAQQLLSGAASPVAVAPYDYGEEEERELRRVGVAFDGSPESQEALAGANRLARDASARVRVITVVERPAFGGVAVSTLAPAESATRVYERELRAGHDAALAGEAGGASVEGVFVEGDAIEVLLEQSRELDVLMAGSRGYGPLGAVLLGSTTRELTQGAGCPLVVFPRRRDEEA